VAVAAARVPLRFVRRLGARGTDRDERRGVDEPRTGLARGRERMAQAWNVQPVEALALRRPHAHEGGHVADGPAPLPGAGQGGPVDHVTLDDRGTTGQAAEVARLAGQDAQGVAARGERPGHALPQEARPPGEEDDQLRPWGAGGAAAPTRSRQWSSRSRNV